jgi:hypothetical protein
LQYDTGGYLARWYEPVSGAEPRVAYGLILNAGATLSFWPVVLGQCALTVWVIALIMRVHGLGGRPGLLAGIVAALVGILHPALAYLDPAHGYFRRARGARTLSSPAPRK